MISALASCVGVLEMAFQQKGWAVTFGQGISQVSKDRVSYGITIKV